MRQGFSVVFGACPGTSSCRPGWPRTHRDPPASASRVLGLKACATTAQQNILFEETNVLHLWICSGNNLSPGPIWRPIVPIPSAEKHDQCATGPLCLIHYELLNTAIYRWAVVAHAFNPSAREAEAGGSL